MKQTLKYFLAFVLTIGLISCGADSRKKLTDGSTDEPSTEPEGSSLDYPLYVEFQLRWETADSGTSYDTFQTCSIPKNSATGTAVTCNIAVPEGRLYFSDIRFRIGTNSPTTCSLVVFTPYYYQRSDSAAYTPPKTGSSPVDCSGTNADEEADCWGGSAPHIVPDFPLNRGIYFLPAAINNKTFDLNSGNKLRTYRTDTNYHVANDLTATGISVTDGTDKERIGSTWQNHVILCEDIWADPIYAITLMIEDVDTDGGPSSPPQDHHEDWN